MLANEFRYFLKQPLVWVAAFLYLGFAVLISFGVQNPDIVAIKQLHYKTMTLLVLAMPLMIGALSPTSFIRDHNTNMTELISATPTPFALQLKTRAVALFGFCFVTGLLGAIICAILISFQINSSPLFYVYNLVWDLIVLYLPSIAVFVALTAYVSRRFNSSATVYALFVSIWAGYMVLASLTGIAIMAGSYVANDTLLWLMIWFDPFGISAVFNQFRAGADSASLDTAILFNRGFYIALACALLYHTITMPPRRPTAHSKLAKLFNGIRKRSDRKVVFGLIISPIWSHFATSTKSLLSNRLNQLLLLGWFFLIFSEVAAGVSHVEPLSILVPTSVDAWNRIAFDIIPLLGNALLLFWAWQICWRGAQMHISELIAATPMTSIQLAVANLMSSLTMLLVILFIAALATFAAEIHSGSLLVFGHYLLQLAILVGPLTVSAVLFVAINTFATNRIMAAFLCLIILALKFTPIMSHLGFEHPLWNITGVPLLPPDEFWNFAGSLTIYIPYMVFWSAVSLSVFLVAVIHSHRGTGFSRRWRGLSRNQKWLSVSCFFVIVFSAQVMHKSLLAQRPLLTKQAQHQWRATYEQKYSHWQTIPQPQVTNMKVLGDFFPNEGRAHFNLELSLTNNTETAIERILVGGIYGFVFDSLELENASLANRNVQLNQHEFALLTPMAPNASLVLKAVLSYQQPSLWPAALHQIVSPRFSYFRSNPAMPYVGFNSDFILRNPIRRRELGLGELTELKPTDYWPDSNPPKGSYSRMTVHSIISTDEQQEVVAPGKLISRQNIGDRSVFEFKTQQPIRNIAAWFSLPFSSMHVRQNTTELHVYAPDLQRAQYTDAAKVNLQGMTDTLNWFSANVAPYRGARLNLIAIPELGATGYAMPQNMLVGHKVGFRALPKQREGSEARFDHRYRRAVHETAHQWFGHDLGNGVDWDRTFLIEAMAKYIELVVIEQFRSEQELNTLINMEYQRFRFATSNNTVKAVALLDASSRHDMYSRATLVFTILREEMGDLPIINTLRQLWRQNQYPNRPASSLDFVKLLLANSDAKHQHLIERLLLSNDVEFLINHPRFKP